MGPVAVWRLWNFRRVSCWRKDYHWGVPWGSAALPVCSVLCAFVFAAGEESPRLLVLPSRCLPHSGFPSQNKLFPLNSLVMVFYHCNKQKWGKPVSKIVLILGNLQIKGQQDSWAGKGTCQARWPECGPRSTSWKDRPDPTSCHRPPQVLTYINKCG